jgi:actin-like ATPase involved in cell morphogenesis
MPATCVCANRILVQNGVYAIRPLRDGVIADFEVTEEMRDNLGLAIPRAADWHAMR